jgi:hypothetical protein
MLSRTVLLFLSLAGIMACQAPCTVDVRQSPAKAEVVRHALRITPDSSTATVRTRVTFTLSSTPALPKPYSVSWRIGSDQFLRANTDTVSYTFTTLGVHALTAIYIDSTGSARDSAITTITINEPPPSGNELGAFVMTINNETFNRANVPTYCTAGASLLHTLPNGFPGEWLGLLLNYSRTKYSNYGDIRLQLNMRVSSYAPATYPIGAYEDYDRAYGDLTKDSKNFRSLPGGSVTISSFDTVRNTISGSFWVVFQSLNGGELDTVSGSFNAVCLTWGTFGQGSYSATAGTLPFRATPDSIVAYYIPATDGIRIIAAHYVPTQYILDIYVKAPHVGTFPVTATSPSPAYGTYWLGFDEYINIDGGGGSVTITKYDTVTRRISATFSFTLKSINGPRTIDVTDGVIDNVIWARE